VRREPKGCSIAALAEVRIERSQRNSGGRCCGSDTYIGKYNRKA
jgi:hypothetical protein